MPILDKDKCYLLPGASYIIKLALLYVPVTTILSLLSTMTLFILHVDGFNLVAHCATPISLYFTI